ncbi:acetyl-CoA carboxylase biotin carboxyl carrier protein [Rhizobium etli]|uniref:acetyl-CoA carboxylase biotin carboxyl carrier protein n=1 Tax=Rhizobium etli TaxID=29449 RepID=UPI0003838F1E|nr:acetyl-CoA carboxylase biotin carboxyl carrier protein subunit [Rhizobium etli]AGS25820.1 biotin carboxyl carrier protein AccB-like protein [Rhizobium etli bv. mimosae str. Mim1]
MDLSKIKTLIDFVGRSNVTELSVKEKELTVRIFRNPSHCSNSAAVEISNEVAEIVAKPTSEVLPKASNIPVFQLRAPVFGVLHRAPAPGQEPFVKTGDVVEEGQTLFIIEAMKVFNAVAAPRAGRVTRLIEIDGGEVEPGDVLAEIA